MNALEKIKAAHAAAQAIIAGFKQIVGDQPDVVEARRTALLEEVASMKNGDKVDHLIAKIITLEAPKSENKVKVEDIAKALMESPECAILNWADVADIIVASGLGEKTSQASISSYASKKKGDWNIAPREKMSFKSADLLAAANG